MAEQLSGLLRILQLSGLADLVESLPGYRPECLSVELWINLVDDACIHSGQGGRRAVQETRHRSVDLLLLEVDEPLLICSDATGMKQVLLDAEDVLWMKVTWTA